MSDLFREAPVGQLIRFVTRNRYLQYPEEKADWNFPNEAYEKNTEKVSSLPTTLGSSSTTLASTTPETETKEASEGPNPLTTSETHPDVEGQHFATITDRSLSRIATRPDFAKIESSAGLEEAYEDAIRQETIKQQPSRPIQPSKTEDGRTLVDWWSTDDQENPQNWSKGKKALVVLQIYLYTLAVYIAGAIYTPAIPQVIEQFGVSPTVASLGLSVYVAGYGIGPLLFSPLSEIPIIGRNPPYMITFAIYVILTIPLSLINNFPGFVVLRFFQGFFGSPALATGGATIGDLYSLIEMPYYLLGWAGFATAGPALGPLISGFSVPVVGWHWSMWEVLWLAAPVFVSLMFFLPETSAQTILLRRAARLRQRTGNSNLVSQSEIDQSQLTVSEVVESNLWRPLQINILDPAVLFTSVYIAIIYAIFYSFFEAFPIVFGTGQAGSNPTKGYGMNLGEQGLIFLSISVGVSIAIIIYLAYLHYVATPEIKARGLGAPERRLIPGLYASLFQPVGLFIFAWTAFNAPAIHWIVPTIGITIYMISTFIIFQVVFIYIPLTYPQYAASLFAANDFARSSMAAGAIHFARPLFANLGIGRGVSLLGGLTVSGVLGIYTLYFYGDKLRAKSRFAAK